MNKAWNRIKQVWEENPIAVIVVASLAVTAGAKLMDANTERRNSHTWEKEVQRRTMKAA